MCYAFRVAISRFFVCLSDDPIMNDMDYIDPEAERPKGYLEFVSSDKSWDEAGMRIRWTEPLTPGQARAFVESPLKLRLCVETKLEMDVPPEDLTAWCWTPVITENNPMGIWKEIPLQCNPKCTQWDDHGIRVYVFQGKLQALVGDTYRLTFNIKHEKTMIWANYFQDDNFASLETQPSVGTQTPQNAMVHFTSNYVEGDEDQNFHFKEFCIRPCKSRKRSSTTQGKPSVVSQ